VPTVTPTIVNSGGQTIVTLSFSGANTEPGTFSLTDGIYKLTLNSAFIVNGSGQAFDGDADGNPGGNFLFPFHRLFGDSNGDATVNASDFADFGSGFGFSISNPSFNSAFDYNEDGAVNALDFGEFGNRFGKTLL
jgi:hypothetical protein